MAPPPTHPIREAEDEHEGRSELFEAPTWDEQRASLEHDFTMARRILISVDAEESRVAIIDGTRLENLEIEAEDSEGRRGNIYKGVIHKVEQSLQAAFVDFGEEKQGFLPLSEIHERLWPANVKNDKRPDITQLLQNKQELMVQIVKDEIGTKGATLTTYVSLPGRYLVLMPDTEKHGISRRVTDVDRRRLKETVDDIGVPDGFGVIIRTAGRDQRPLELKKDLLYLTKLYDTVEQKFKERRAAGLVYRDRCHAVRFIRDYFTDDIEEIWVNNRGILKEISEFMAVLMPGAREKLRLYEGESPLFLKFGAEDQIESVFARRVELPSGGSIVMDATEALVAIDVNSGRVKEKDIEETALTANLEAAEEIARQVIIRDLGGLLVCDFIDMRDKKHNRLVEQRLREAFARDKAKLKFGRISEFGLMELSRQRLRKSLSTSVARRCEACDGTGRVRSPASAGLSLLRRIEEACLRGGVKYVRATTPLGIANLLLNRRRKDLVELEQKLGTIVEVVAHADMPANLVALDIVVMKGPKQPPQRLYQLCDLIRNEVVRKEQSPLPKPEDGLEALEFDHAAIYAAIAERDALLRAEEAAKDDDFEFRPIEPDVDGLADEPIAKLERVRIEREGDGERERGRGRNRGGRDRDRDRDGPRGRNRDRDGRREPRRGGAGEGPVPATEGAAPVELDIDEVENTPADVVESTPAANGARPETATPQDGQGDRRGVGFLGWMKRIFTPKDEMGSPGGGEPSLPPVTEQAVAKRIEERRHEHPVRPPPPPTPAARPAPRAEAPRPPAPPRRPPPPPVAAAPRPKDPGDELDPEVDLDEAPEETTDVGGLEETGAQEGANRRRRSRRRGRGRDRSAGNGTPSTDGDAPPPPTGEPQS